MECFYSSIFLSSFFTRHSSSNFLSDCQWMWGSHCEHWNVCVLCKQQNAKLKKRRKTRTVYLTTKEKGRKSDSINARNARQCNAIMRCTKPCDWFLEFSAPIQFNIDTICGNVLIVCLHLLEATHFLWLSLYRRSLSYLLGVFVSVSHFFFHFFGIALCTNNDNIKILWKKGPKRIPLVMKRQGEGEWESCWSMCLFAAPNQIITVIFQVFIYTLWRLMRGCSFDDEDDV